MRVLPLCFIAALLSGCATGTPGGSPGAGRRGYRPFSPAASNRSVPANVAEVVVPVPVVPSGAREKAVLLAQSLVGKKQIRIEGRRYADDCSGLVGAVFDQLGMELTQDAQAGDNAVTAMYRFAQNHGRVFQEGMPSPGDLVFFRETYDRNRDGRANDGLTHVGIVESVDREKTVQVIHRVNRGVVRYRMNLAQPNARALNDSLRAPGSSGEVLTGQLFAAWGSILPSPAAVARR